MSWSPQALVLGAGLAGTAVLFRARGLPALRRWMATYGLEGASGPPPTPASPWTWCDINADNQVRLYLPKLELGQGVHTALAQAFADELDLAWEQLTVAPAPLSRGFPGGIATTGGSTTMASMIQPVRVAASTLRLMLRTEAARYFDCALEDVLTDRGHCRQRGGSGVPVSYGQLVAQKDGAWHIPPAPALKKSSDFSLIGRPLARVDARQKLTGQAAFAQDIALPGMLYGAIGRPPRYGARLVHVGQIERAQQHPGVVAVVVERFFVGVVAERRTQARAALGMLDLRWSGGVRTSTVQLEDLVTVGGKGVVIERAGAARKDASGERVQAEYRTGSVLALPLAPGVAVAHVQRQQVTITTATQAPQLVQLQIALALRRPLSQIRVDVPYVGGSFGRNVLHPVVVEASRLSAAVGRPVQVAWTLEEELRYSRQRPLSHHHLTATLAPNGTIAAIEHQLASGPHFGTIPPMALLAHAIGVDGASVAGASNPYHGIPRRQVRYYHRHIPAVPTGGFRAFGFPLTVFAAESFMDELASHVGVDPIAFRLRHLADDVAGRRCSRVLSALDTVGWRSSAPAGHARGVALGRLYANTVTAVLAEVSIANGKIRVHRLVCAVDAGLIVNPQGARAQVEGALLMALSWALYEEQRIDDGMATATTLADYPLLPFADTPAIEVLMLETDNTRVGGVGEPPIAPVAAAVANAVYALTGERLRSLPLRFMRSLREAV